MWTWTPSTPPSRHRDSFFSSSGLSEVVLTASASHMATNKNQHFVPRCYLRPFTLDSANVAINLFNIDRMKFVERAPVKHQCSRDYFYGEDPALEKALQAEEGLYAAAARDILTPDYTLTDTHRAVL